MVLVLKSSDSTNQIETEFESTKLVDLVVELRRQGINDLLDGSGNRLEVSVDDPYKALKHLKRVSAI